MRGPRAQAELVRVCEDKSHAGVGLTGISPKLFLKYEYYNKLRYSFNRFLLYRNLLLCIFIKSVAKCGRQVSELRNLCAKDGDSFVAYFRIV